MIKVEEMENNISNLLVIQFFIYFYKYGFLTASISPQIIGCEVNLHIFSNKPFASCDKT